MLTTDRNIQDGSQILYTFMLRCLILSSSFSQSLWMYLVFATVCRIWREICFVLQFCSTNIDLKASLRVLSSCTVGPPLAESFAGCMWFDTGIVTETRRCDFATANTPSGCDVTVSAHYMSECSRSSVHLATVQRNVFFIWHCKAHWLFIVCRSATRFKVLKFHVLPTQLYLCVLCGSENKQRLFPYTALAGWFLGAFAKLRKATISVVMSVCPHGTTGLPRDGFSWQLICEYFPKPRGDQVLLKSDKSNGHFTWRPVCMVDHIFLEFLLRMRNVTDEVVEEIEAHVLSSATFLRR
jgi:hypothetical protein